MSQLMFGIWVFDGGMVSAVATVRGMYSEILIQFIHGCCGYYGLQLHFQHDLLACRSVCTDQSEIG